MKKLIKTYDFADTYALRYDNSNVVARINILVKEYYDEKNYDMCDFSIEFVRFNNGNGHLTANLCMFCDSWRAFIICPDFFTELTCLDEKDAPRRDITPEEIMKILDKCGFDPVEGVVDD